MAYCEDASVFGREGVVEEGVTEKNDAVNTPSVLTVYIRDRRH
jgi:hypothetical protein